MFRRSLSAALVAGIACAPDPNVAKSAGPAERRGTEHSRLLRLEWTDRSEHPQAKFGHSVASAGDVNGDGFADVVVGAPGYDTTAVFAQGGAVAFLGSATGLGAAASWKAESDQHLSQFGYAVASAGDVDDDGFADVIVGAHGYDNPESIEGRAFLYTGSATGLAALPGWTAESDESNSFFGISVAAAGDVNGDGHGDVVVGAPGFGGPGAVFVYQGSVLGLDAAAAWSAQGAPDTEIFGVSVASAGDVNSDGYADVVVGRQGPYLPMVPGEGAAFVYLGSALGLESTEAWFEEDGGPDDTFGRSVSTAADVNGDGHDDLVVGAPRDVSPYGSESLPGSAFVYYGGTTGLETTPAWIVEGEPDPAGGDLFGSSVASAGDVNGDGYSDIVVGAPQYLSAQGKAYLYLGSASGLTTREVWTATGETTAAAEFGFSVAGAGDVNGDGYDDVAIGAADTQGGSGNAYLFVGGCGMGPLPEPFADGDGDLVGDTCDVCAGADDLLDSDLDDVPQDCDVCPFVYDPDQRDGDGVGVGDACVPLTLTVDGISLSQGLSVQVDGAPAGSTVTVLMAKGLPVLGPCPRLRVHGGLCLDVGVPNEHWEVVADAAGHASLAGAALPDNAGAYTVVTVQAAVELKVGGVKSDPIVVAIAL